MNAKDYYQGRIDAKEQIAQEYDLDARAFKLAGDSKRAETACEHAADIRREAELFRKAKAAEESSG